MFVTRICINAGRDVSDAFEMSVQMTLVGKTAESGDFGERRAFGDFGFGAIDS